MKRLFDIVVSLILIIILLPLEAFIAVVVLIDAGRPVIFRQYRVGRNNKLFYIYKFRTMKNSTRNVATKKLRNSNKCITVSGKILRKMSLDELPQLFNILRGDMSFVGPRPLIPEEKEIREMRAENGIYAVRPGLTGLAQINGRDEIDDETKTEFDKEYIENAGILLDLKILAKTVLVVFKADGIREGQEAVSRPVGKKSGRRKKCSEKRR